jgi:hypothetical protein
MSPSSQMLIADDAEGLGCRVVCKGSWFQPPTLLGPELSISPQVRVGAQVLSQFSFSLAFVLDNSPLPFLSPPRLLICSVHHKGRGLVYSPFLP